MKPYKKAGPGEQLARGLFGRRAGKPLNARQIILIKNLLPKLELDIDAARPNALKDLFPEGMASFWLEIGFGGGEHLIHRAIENPSCGFIGVEPFRNGMAKALVSIDDARLSNVRLYNDDGGGLLDWLPEKVLDGVYLLYPDPWPKKRHFKRRFINPKNLDRIARALKPGQEFRFASDIDSYVEWTLEHCHNHPAFTLRDDLDVLTPWANWPSTRYEAKAIREGRIPRYLTFRVS